MLYHVAKVKMIVEILLNKHIEPIFLIKVKYNNFGIIINRKIFSA